MEKLRNVIYVIKNFMFLWQSGIWDDRGRMEELR